MERKKNRTAIVIALIGAALAVFWQAPGAGAEEETFENQCPGGKVEVWPTYTGTGQDSYFEGTGEVTVEFSFPPSDVVRTVVVTLVAISTGPDCTQMEVRTRTRLSTGRGTSPDPPGRNFNLPAGAATFGGYNSFGDFTPGRTRILAKRPNGDDFLLTTSTGTTLVGGPDQAFEAVSPGGSTTCHNGRFYYGIKPNGQTWSSGCITAQLAGELGYDEDNSSVSSPDPGEVYDKVTSGLPGHRYERVIDGQKVSTIGCTLRLFAPAGAGWTRYDCTMP